MLRASAFLRIKTGVAGPAISLSLPLVDEGVQYWHWHCAKEMDEREPVIETEKSHCTHSG